MINKEAILKKLSKIEDKLLVSKIIDKAERAEYKNGFTNSDFLDPYQRNIVEKALKDVNNLNYTYDGGYEGAERVIIIFRPDFIYSDDDMFDESPFKLVKIGVQSREMLTHRDYLGALMGLGIKREKIGDILVKDESCNIIVLSEIADYIMYNLDKVGNARVSVVVEEVDDLESPEQKVKEINASVASLRLDCIASAGFGISRGKMVEYIRAEKVNLNWDTASSPTKQVKAGDTISIRGKGRLVLDSIGGTTKKDRIKVLLKKYI